MARDVAVVGFAQRQTAHFDGSPSMVELLVPIFGELWEQTGWTKDDIGFWCSGSSDYLAGRAFSFVSAVDAIGTLPPVNESHVEMDAAWALYEAWVKIQTGEVDTAVVYGFGKSSAGVLRRVLALQLDPYVLTPLWPDTVSIAAMQARLGLESGAWSYEDLASVVAPVASRRSGQPLGDPVGRHEGRRPAGRADVRRPAAQARLRPGDRRRGSDRARRRGPRARRARPSGVDHRAGAPLGRSEPLPAGPGPGAVGGRRRPPGSTSRGGGGRAARAVQPPGADAARRARPRRRVRRSRPRAARCRATRCSPAG